MLALPRVERRQRLPAPRSRDSRSAWTISRLDPRVPYSLAFSGSRLEDPDSSNPRLEWGQGRNGDRNGIGAGIAWGQGWHDGRDGIGAGKE
jgi:hypothetical protein